MKYNDGAKFFPEKILINYRYNTDFCVNEQQENG